MLYLSKSVESCYGPEEEAAAAAEAAAAEAAAVAAAARAAAVGVETKFSQEDVNRIVAADRRKLEEALKKTEAVNKELLASKNLTEQERKSLEDNLSAVQGQLRTKEQQAAIDRKAMEEAHAAALSETEEKGRLWEALYRDSTIDRELIDAGSKNDAWQPSQIMTQLRPWTRLIEVVDEKTNKSTGRYKVVVDFPDVNATTGDPEMTTRSPEEAVKRMKELPDIYGNLFKANVASGIGANSTGGASLGGDGKLTAKQISSLSPAKYREIRREHPEYLGLRPNK
jgi:hypothetical protein